MVVSGVTPRWWPVTRGVPRAPCWGPFSVFMEGLAEGMERSLSQFAGGPQLGGSVGRPEGRRLCRGSGQAAPMGRGHCTRFHQAQCRALPLGHSNPRSATGWGRAAGQGLGGKGLGVLAGSRLGRSQQGAQVARKAGSVLAGV